MHLRSLQELLGHSRFKITEVYTSVSNKSIGKIANPLEQALQKISNYIVIIISYYAIETVQSLN